jgi:hypothetical protein
VQSVGGFMRVGRRNAAGDLEGSGSGVSTSILDDPYTSLHLFSPPNPSRKFCRCPFCDSK